MNTSSQYNQSTRHDLTTETANWPNSGGTHRKAILDDAFQTPRSLKPQRHTARTQDVPEKPDPSIPTTTLVTTLATAQDACIHSKQLSLKTTENK